MGRRIKVREDGFALEIASLTRLRSALRLDPNLPRTEVDPAIKEIDALIDRLCTMTHSIRARAG